MKPEDNALQRAVRSVLFTGAITAFAVSPMAMAQQDDEDEEEEEAVELGQQVVTGSRIKRIDLENSRPVVVITREDIELSGQESVADVLRNSPLNTSGSFRETSGNSFAGQATINLHGIGSNRSLVLLDGRKAPRSPVQNNFAVDLNILPIAAVDRIEILTDSASAIYGSDAIGGVINIILRKDYDGMEISGFVNRPSRDGADRDSGGITMGGSTSRGRFLLAADFSNKERIASRERDYARGDPGYGSTPLDYPNAPFDATWYAWGAASNISANGNTIWSPYWKAAPSCETAVDPDTGDRLFIGPYLIPGPDIEICGYDYTAISWETGNLDRSSGFLHADYEVSPDLALRFQSVFSTTNFHGRYAPALGGLVLTEESAQGLKEGFGYDIPYPQFLPYLLRHRFVGLGPRDANTTNTYFENALLAYGNFGMFDYELEARNTRYDGKVNSCCYARRSNTLQLVEEGGYNPFEPLDPQNNIAYDTIRTNTDRDIRADLRTYSGNVSFDLFDAPAGPVGWAVGFDYIDEDYKDVYDPISTSGDLIGSAGNASGFGERESYAFFGESYVPMLSGWEVSAALRWDHYDEAAGSQLSAYLSTRYQPTDWLLFRASWGQGFRAGDLDDLYGARSISYDFGTDLAGCLAQGISEANCTNQQYATLSGGNPSLKPETSDSYNIGFVVDWEPITVRMDYWTVDLEQGISGSSLSGLLFTEANGGCADTGRVENTIDSGLPARIIECSPGNLLKRDPNTGALLEAEAVLANIDRFQFGGVDFLMRYLLETAVAGDFVFQIQGSRRLKIRGRTANQEDWTSSLGIAGSLKYAATGLIRWNYGDHTLSAYFRHLDGYTRPSLDFEAPSHTEYDLHYRWRTPWDGEINLGVRNLTDEDPELDSEEAPANYSLYGLDGRVPYVSYRHFF